MNALLFSFPLGWRWVMILILLTLFSIIPAILCVRRAEKLNRSKHIWGILGVVLSYWAVLIIYILEKEPDRN